MNAGKGKFAVKAPAGSGERIAVIERKGRGRERFRRTRLDGGHFESHFAARYGLPIGLGAQRRIISPSARGNATASAPATASNIFRAALNRAWLRFVMSPRL